MTWGYNNELTVSYAIPNSGKYQHDRLASELAGAKARETSWGTLMYTSHQRLISYAFEERSDFVDARERFKDSGLFQILTD